MLHKKRSLKHYDNAGKWQFLGLEGLRAVGNSKKLKFYLIRVASCRK